MSSEDIDRWTRHLWHTSQHNRMVIALGGRIQRVVDEMRAAAGLPAFGWDTAFPDADFGECTVHVDGCDGQETHGRLTPVPPGPLDRAGNTPKTLLPVTVSFVSGPFDRASGLA